MLEGKSFDSEYSLFETCSFDTHYSDDKNERIKTSITDSLISQHTYEYQFSDILVYVLFIGINDLILTFLVVYFF
jgi:20S proteasome alpha/beta subunit